MKKLMNIAAAVLATAATSYAHDGHAHKLMGTVKAVHAAMSHVEITVKGGKTEGFYVNADTKYVKGSTALALADLKPGTRVVVETKKEGDETVATHVRVGTAKAASAPASPAPHHH